MDNDDENNTQSPDDALLPDDNSSDSTIPPLPEDNDTPAAPAQDHTKAISEDDPRTDAELDSHELYDEGRTGATDVDAQHESNDDPSRTPQ